ncbi:hypothetical protein KBX35_03545 [Micromonospora sp. C32]|uniref:MmpS family transport accessory protein n=1 Tax=unclassified Micromonospora TaxID=2617518 RepID=UPI001B3843E9|nr:MULTISPECIES: MmpS family transport accessory protein [unclassified Micromonospora]MBQ1044589.1 hypothetical protein [Micromonospora sp. C72]MBQ1053860.1 hypothetical protein [Micromonospora sp. C32]
MSETTPAPEPTPGPVDPTATPVTPQPSTWTPPDPLAAPQPWTPPEPWSPSSSAPSSAPGAEGGHPAPAGGAEGRPAGEPGRADPAGTPGAGDQGQPGTPGGWPSPPASIGAPQWTGPPGAPDWSAQPGNPGSPPQPGAYHPGAYPPGPYPSAAYPPGPYPPPYAYPGMPPRRSGGGWAVGVVVGIITVLALIVCSCAGLAVIGSTMDDGTAAGSGYEEPIYGEPGEWTDESSASPAGPATTPSGGPGKYTVLYEVTGSKGDAEVQYYDANGDFHQFNLVDSSWRLRFTTNNRERVQIVTLPGSAAGLTCRITIDGKVVSQKSGRWGVTCFGW